MNARGDAIFTPAEPELSSAALLTAVGEGDHCALSELFDRYAPVMNSLCHRLVSPDDTDAALTAVWVFVWKNSPALSQLAGTTQSVLLNATARVIRERSEQSR